MTDLLQYALTWYNEREYAGSKHNPNIVDWSDDIVASVDDDETAWCSSYINKVARETGYETSEKLDARSWLKVGESVSNPEPGHIVVFWRESRNSWKGHVGIFIRKQGDQIWVLGGNQNNRVSIAPYPSYRLLGYRKLNKV